MADAEATTAPRRARGRLSASSLDTVRKDLFAGLTVAAISLPQSMAYALIAGVDIRFGIYTAIVFTAVAAVFGSSRHLVNGPTGAVSLVVFSALAIFEPEAKLDSYEAMFLLAIMIGVTARHDPDLAYTEEEEDFSATLRAIRRAYALAAIDRRGDRPAQEIDGGTPADAGTLKYYLV